MMGKLRTLALGAVALAALGAAPAFAVTNLITNGDFTTSVVGQFNNAGSATGWTVTATGVGGTGPANPAGSIGYGFIFDNSTAFGATGGSPGQYGNVSLYGTAAANGTPQPTRFFGVDSTFHPSILSQTIAGGLTPGATYDLTFEWAAAQQTGFTGVTTDAMRVSLGGGAPVTLGPVTNPSGGFTGWMNASVQLVAGTGTDITFFDIGTCVTNPNACAPNASGGPPFSLLDSVSLSVPEPSTWAMMLLGFVGLGYAGFRSRRTAISIV